MSSILSHRQVTRLKPVFVCLKFIEYKALMETVKTYKTSTLETVFKFYDSSVQRVYIFEQFCFNIILHCTKKRDLTFDTNTQKIHKGYQKRNTPIVQLVKLKHFKYSALCFIHHSRLKCWTLKHKKAENFFVARRSAYAI